MDEVRDMRPMLLSVAKGILDSDEEAEDVVQDAMLRLWQLREEPIRNPKGFARTVVRNMSLSKVRRRPLTVDINQADMATNDDTATDRNEQIDRMMELVDALPTMQQTVLRLRHMQDMTMADIASLIGTSEVAVRQSLSRARRSIIEQFKTIATTLEEERTLYEYFQGGDIADDLKPYREAFQGFAAVSGIDKPMPQRQTPAWVIALRTVTSMAAIFLVGLFFFVNGETPEAPQLATTTTATAPTPAFCEGSTPRELYMCYMERKRETLSVYSLIKKRIYENGH